MSNTAIKILMCLEKQGELTLEEIAFLLPKKFKDHRDFYIFACLVANGYVDDNRLIDNDEPDPNRNKEQLLARRFFACSTADTTAKYENFTYSKSGGGTLKGEKFALSGKGSLYLSDNRAKRFDRIFTLAAGIVIGIIVAMFGSLF